MSFSMRAPGSRRERHVHNERALGRSCTTDGHEHCAVCADDGLAVEVVAIDHETNTATALADGTEHVVALDLTEGVRIGDTIIVHLGFAIARVGDDTRHGT